MSKLQKFCIFMFFTFLFTFFTVASLSITDIIETDLELIVYLGIGTFGWLILIMLSFMLEE